jgi:HPt (histidine-containing phosphotransfer) domain-containing protein
MTKLYNLNNLKSMIGDDLKAVEEFVSLFLDTSQQTMETLNAAYDEENYTQVGAMAHKLKSSIDLMGIDALKTDIRTIEKIGKNQDDLGELKTLLPRLNEIMEKVYAQMNEEFEK